MKQQDWSAVIDYYADRNVVPVKNIDSARYFVQEWGVQKAVWIEQKELHLQKIAPLR